MHKCLRDTVILAGMPESGHMDVNLSIGTSLRSNSCIATKLPSMALDTGIHAGMTIPGQLCITMGAQAWERSI